MNLTEELTQAFFEHEDETGNKPRKLRIHENLWNELRQELEQKGALVDQEKPEGDSEENPLQFYGASVTLVTSDKDPMGFLRYSIQ